MSPEERNEVWGECIAPLMIDRTNCELGWLIRE